MEENELTKIEKAYENIPEEVKSFVYGYDFTTKLKGFCKNINLSNEQQRSFVVTLYDYVAQLISENELISNINSISSSAEVNQKIIDWVKENLVEKILEVSTNKFMEIETEDLIKETSEKSSDNSLNIIRSSLNSPSAITQTKRDYSLEKEGGATLTKDIEKPKIDPYRELPSE